MTRPDSLEPMNLWDIVVGRNSRREFQKLSIEQISQVLWLSAKVNTVSVQSNGFVLSHRRSASAGARHPIDIIILSPILDSFKSLYYYNPFEHTLNKLILDNALIAKFKEHLNLIFDISDATIVWFIAHSDRTEAKYDNPLSLVWRDAGALIHSVQIACTGCSISSCPVGSLGEPFISQLFGVNTNIFGVGGIMIG
jgi:SagB-type dehydrogenase family enzyme